MSRGEWSGIDLRVGGPSSARPSSRRFSKSAESSGFTARYERDEHCRYEAELAQKATQVLTSLLIFSSGSSELLSLKHNSSLGNMRENHGAKWLQLQCKGGRR